MPSRCLLASIASDEKLAVNLIEGPLYTKRAFSVTTFRIFCLFWVKGTVPVNGPLVTWW